MNKQAGIRRDDRGRCVNYLVHMKANMEVAARCLVLSGFHFIHGLFPSEYTAHRWWGV